VSDVWLIVWLVTGVVLVLAEVFTTTFVLLMFAVGAFAAAIAGGLGLDPAWQVVIFALVSGLALGVARPALRQHLAGSEQDVPMGVHAMEGKIALVLEAVAEDSGMIKIEGELWRARPLDSTQAFAVGDRVRVIEFQGATALVWKD
jgi:membrane protein implicated in regulation of membrane protease activity